MLMPGRKYAADNLYRYGFNGKENDNEVKGEGLQLDYGFRVYDPRLGRFLSVDPLIDKYPMLTPYQFASNMPIIAIDIDGLEGKIEIYATDDKKQSFVRVVTESTIEEAKQSLRTTGGFPDGKLEIHGADGFKIPAGSKVEWINNVPASGDNPGNWVAFVEFQTGRIDANSNAVSKMSREQYAQIATKLGVETSVVIAIASVESSGNGFDKKGDAKVRFEGHWFRKFLSKDKYNIKDLVKDGYEDVIYEYADRNKYRHGSKQYEKAKELNSHDAMLSTSYGAFQIMGFNYKQAGFNTVEEFVAAQATMAGQVEAFITFVANDPKLLKAIKDKDFATFARLYNGPDYKKQKYDTKMKIIYDQEEKKGP